MRGGKKTKETVQQTTTPTLDPMLQSQISNLFGQVSGALQNLPGPYTGEYHAGQNPLQKLGQGMMAQNALGFNPAEASQASLPFLESLLQRQGGGIGPLNLPGASELFSTDPNSLDFSGLNYLAPEFNNDALQGAIDARIAPLASRFSEEFLPSWKSELGGQGAFDSLRSDFDFASHLENQLARPATQAAAELIFQANESNLDRMQRASEFGANFDLSKAGLDLSKLGLGLDRDRSLADYTLGSAGLGLQRDALGLQEQEMLGSQGLQAAGMIPQIAEAIFGMGLLPGGVLEGIGSSNQADEQARLDRERQAYLDQLLAPFMGLGAGADIISSFAPYLTGSETSGTSTTQSKSGLLSEILKGVIGVGGMAGGLGWSPFGKAA